MQLPQSARSRFRNLVSPFNSTFNRSEIKMKLIYGRGIAQRVDPIGKSCSCNRSAFMVVNKTALLNTQELRNWPVETKKSQG